MMKKTISGLVAYAGLIGVLYVSPALASDDARINVLGAEIKALKDGQAAMQQQLKAITDLLKRAPRPAPVAAAVAPAPSGDAGTAALRKELEVMRKTVKRYKDREDRARQARLPVRPSDAVMQVGDDPFKGSPDARLVLVEFTDYQCPFCGRHKKNTMPQLLKNYIDAGKLRYVMRDFPLAFHKNAPKAHEAAHCAGDQGKYWDMHEQLFANQRKLQAANLPGYAQAAGVADITAFQSCLDNGKYAERGQKSMAEGQKAGVRGTPSFLLGFMEPDGKTFKAKRFIRGAQQYPAFEKAIKEVLEPAPAPKG